MYPTECICGTWGRRTVPAVTCDMWDENLSHRVHLRNEGLNSRPLGGRHRIPQSRRGRGHHETTPRQLAAACKGKLRLPTCRPKAVVELGACSVHLVVVTGLDLRKPAMVPDDDDGTAEKMHPGRAIFNSPTKKNTRIERLTPA